MARPGSWRHLLAGCDAAQVEAITSPAAPLLVVAGAGSGKTRVLTRRIAWRIAQEQAVPRHVLALTFTRKAAGELRGRLAALGLPAPVTAGTFHAVALAQLRRRAAERDRRPPGLLESKVRLLAPLLGASGGRRAGGRDGRPGGRPGLGRQELLAALATEIEWAKGRLLRPDAYEAAANAAGRAGPLEAGEVARCYAAYEDERARRGLLDFDDLLLGLLEAITSDAAFAAAQRWQFAHLFVDELQDATTLQLRLVDAWLGGRSDLFAVGDPRQSIYAFNGADPDALSGFARRHTGATVLELATNYRSSPQVVTLAAAALPAAPGDAPRAAPRSGRPDGPVPTVRGYADDAAEAAAVASLLRRAHRPGRPWSACAVLARTNAQLEALARALEADGVPFSRPGLAGAPEGAAGLALAELPANLDPGRLRAHLAERVAEASRPPGVTGAPGATQEGAPGAEERRALVGLLELAEDYLAVDGAPSAAGFRSFVRSATTDGLVGAGRDAVELATFHRAKGLEWEVVCVTGLEEGLVPISHARDAAALDEERRLLYVALTRATEQLHCSWAAERSFGQRRSRRQPSPWLGALESARRRLEALPSRATVDAALAASRAALGAERPPPRG